MAKTLFVLGGVVVLCVAAGIGFATQRFTSRAARAEGVVARLNAGGSHPQIEFTTASGTRVSYPQGGFVFGYRVGQTVQVLYDPDDPAHTARVGTVGALWFVPILLLGIGVAFVLSGILGNSSRRRRGSC